MSRRDIFARMCGRYTLASDIGEFLELWGIHIPPELAHPRRYNVAPSQPVLAIMADPRPRVDIMEWGFVPTWARPDSGMKAVINARVESLAEKKPYFRGAFKSARCAILADGFYEWKKVPGGKQPYRIGRSDGGLFAMAGLWSHAAIRGGGEQLTCAIVTVEPNSLMRDIHNRMPAILRPNDVEIWLDPKSAERDLFTTLEPYPAEEMRAYEVSLAVNSPANDDPTLILPLHD